MQVLQTQMVPYHLSSQQFFFFQAVIISWQLKDWHKSCRSLEDVPDSSLQVSEVQI